MLHEDGIELNGVTLQSSVLDYTPTFSNPVGLLPTFAADALYHHKTTVSPPPADLPSFMTQVIAFAQGPYAQALAAFPNSDPATTQTLSQMLGISPVALNSWSLNVEANNGIMSSFLVTLLQDQGLALGAYDGRVTAIDTGISAIVDPASGANDPTMAAVSGVYTAMLNVYLNNDLQFTATYNFVDLNDQVYANWDFSHIDPTGAQKGGKDQSGNPRPLHGGRPRRRHGGQPRPKGVFGQRLLRLGDAVLPDQTHPRRHAARRPRRARQSHDRQLPVGPHDLSRRSVAHGDESGLGRHL